MQHDICWIWVGVPRKTSFTQYVKENPKDKDKGGNKKE